jgi:hypothetical protein
MRAMKKNNIEAQLGRVGLPAKIVERAADVNRVFRFVGSDRSRSNPFLMDIRRSRKDETFVIRPGDAEVHVLNGDPKLHQAVLFVGEPETEIEFMEYDSKIRKNVRRRRKVPAEKRHFLMGMDECHLFVCRLPRAATTVAEAHRILAPETVRSNRALKKKVVRQGEWFFTPVSQDVEEQIAAYIAKYGVLKGQRIGPVGRRGRPHIATEMVRMKVRVGLSARERASQINEFRSAIASMNAMRAKIGVRLSGGQVVRREADLPEFRMESIEYVRGAVKHPDHHSLRLAGWHSVSVNTERTDEIARGMTWID